MINIAKIKNDEVKKNASSPIFEIESPMFKQKPKQKGIGLLKIQTMLSEPNK